MKHKFCFSFICTILVVMLVTALGASARGLTALQTKAYVDEIIAFEGGLTNAETSQQWLNSLQSVNDTEWYAIALCQYDKGVDFGAYTARMLELASKEQNAAATRQKCALVIQLCGVQDDELIGRVVDETVGKQGIMSYVFGLHLLNNGAASAQHTVTSVTEKLLSMQLDGGGWALMGNNGDVDITAMTVQALAPMYEEPTVKEAVDSALEFLSSVQTEDGDFKSYGSPNAESTAQVILALCALGADAAKDERFIKNGNTLIDGLLRYQLDGGGFSHIYGGTYNRNATSQAMCALVGLWRCYEQKTFLYMTDKQEATPTPVPDTDNIPTATPTAALTPVVTATPVITPLPTVETQDVTSGDYRIWACIGIVAVALICCAVSLIKQRSKKNLLFIAVIAAILLILVFAVEIKTPDQYRSEYGPEEKIGEVSIVIDCSTLIGKTDDIPQDGKLLAETTIDLGENETVYDVLVRAARKHGLHMESSGMDSMEYIKGIGNIYELQYGDLSGWIYRVNGEQKSVSCGECRVNDGDVIEWIYSLELGKDVEE